MAFIDNKQVVETFLADRTHPTFGKSIGIRRSNGDADDFDLLRDKHLFKGDGEFPIVVMEEKVNRWVSVFEFPAELSGLLPKQQNLNVFLRFGQLTDSEQVQDGREEMSQCKPEQKGTSSIMKRPL
jgi:hypothetical protein